MPGFSLFHPDTEIIGQVILDFERAVDSEQLTLIFEQHNLTGIRPDHWYPAQRWLDVLTAVAHTDNAAFNLIAIGIRQIELALMPPEFDALPLAAIFAQLNRAYRMNYRGTDIGSITCEQISATHVRLKVRSFEPDDLWYGNLYGIMRRYAPPDTNFTIAFSPDSLRRDEGGLITVFDVSWTPPAAQG